MGFHKCLQIIIKNNSPKSGKCKHIHLFNLSFSFTQQNVCSGIDHFNLQKTLIMILSRPIRFHDLGKKWGLLFYNILRILYFFTDI